MFRPFYVVPFGLWVCKGPTQASPELARVGMLPFFIHNPLPSLSRLFFVIGGLALISLLAVGQDLSMLLEASSISCHVDPSVFEANNVELPSCPSLSYFESLSPRKATDSCDQVHWEQSPQTLALITSARGRYSSTQWISGWLMFQKVCVQERLMESWGPSYEPLPVTHNMCMNHNWWWTKVRCESISNARCHLYEVQEQEALILEARSQIVATTSPW